MDVGLVLLAEHEKKVRRRAPYAGTGKTVVADGPVTRVHAGILGEVRFAGPIGSGAADLIRRQQAAFAAHRERVEWKVYGHDDPALVPALLDAGFTPGWRRPLLVAPVERFRGPVPDGVEDNSTVQGYAEARRIARTGGPHRDPLDELDSDDLELGELSVLTRSKPGQPLEVGWARQPSDSEFIEIGGVVGDHPTDFLPYWLAWSPRGRYRYFGGHRPEPRHFVAEVDGPSYEVLLAAGFHEVSSVQTYHWSPPGRQPQTRPVRTLLEQPEYGEIWEAVDERFSFEPSMTKFPGKVDPNPSVTWALGGPSDRLEEIVERGLRAVVRPGELLRFLDWNHAGVEYDPARVGRPEYPEWQGLAYPDGDYYLNVTPDLRLGTFGHPWEHTLCVFGADLLAEIEDDLTALLGAPVRRT